MIEIFRRTPYAVLLITLMFVFSATWIADNMTTVITPPPTYTFPSHSYSQLSNAFQVPNQATYYIGATDGFIYIYNNMSFKVPQLQFPTYPTNVTGYSPFMKFAQATNPAISARNDVQEALRNSHATNDDLHLFFMTYNPVIIAGVNPTVNLQVLTSLTTSGGTIMNSTESIVWSYNNSEVQSLYSYLQLNAYQIDPEVYYRAAYAYEQLQLAKLAAFYYRYNVFMKNFDVVYLAPGTYTFGTSTVTYTSSTWMEYDYDYKSNTTYPTDPFTAYPLFFNNQTMLITEHFTIYSTSSSLSFDISYEITITGDTYPPYDTFTQMIMFADLLVHNYGVDDGMQYLPDPSKLQLLTNIMFYTFTNFVYPTQLVYAFTGISPEPFPGFNDAYTDANPDITSFEYFMPIYPVFVGIPTSTTAGTLTNRALVSVSTATTLTQSNFTQTIVTYSQTGVFDVVATIPIVLSKGEATKIISITIIPSNNTNTSWTTTLTTTYRTIGQKTISLTVTVPWTITTITNTAITMSFYAIVSVTEEFPLYPTLPLYNVESSVTTYLGIETTTTTTTTELSFTSFSVSTVTVVNDAGTYTTTTLVPTLTTITLTFKQVKFVNVTTFTDSDTVSDESPIIFWPGYSDGQNFVSFTYLTTSITYIDTNGSPTVTAITYYGTQSFETVEVFTKSTTLFTSPYTMLATDFDSYASLFTIYFSIPTTVTTTYYSASISLSPTTIGSSTSYVASLIVDEIVSTPTAPITVVTRNNYVTAFVILLKNTLGTSVTSGATTITKSNVVVTTIAGVVTQITSYTYIVKQSTTYYTTFASYDVDVSYTTMDFTTTYGSITYNNNLTSYVDTYGIIAMSQIYTANREVMFNGELLATRIAANNMLVAYAELDNYKNVVDIRNQWIVSPLTFTINSIETYLTYTITQVGSTSVVASYYTYRDTSGIYLITTAYVDTFAGLLYKEPASPLDLYTSILKINYPGIFDLDYTTYYLTSTTIGQNIIPELTSTVYSSAAAFLLLSETANPADDYPVNLEFMVYTTEPIWITGPSGFPIGIVNVPRIITVTNITTTTYPVVQYYLSQVPYVYVIPIPTASETVSLRYILTVLSYDYPEELPYTFLTTMVSIEYNGDSATTLTMYTVTTTYFYSLLPASSIVAYVSPVYLGLYVLYGMTESDITLGQTVSGAQSTTAVITTWTGSYWINDNWFVGYIEQIYKPVTVTTTYYKVTQTIVSGTLELTTETLVAPFIGYVVQAMQNIPLPTRNYNASDASTMPDLVTLLNDLRAFGMYTVNASNNAYYTYTIFAPNPTPYYVVSATGSSSWVVAEYIEHGTVPIFLMPEVVGSSIALNTNALPSLVPGSFTTVTMGAGIFPLATYGSSVSTIPESIVRFYYIIPFYAAFYNLPGAAMSEATTLPPEFKEIPLIQYMYLPMSTTTTLTTYLYTTVNGLPSPTSTITTVVTIYYGTPLPFSYTTVTFGNSILTYNPSSTSTTT